jgi:hypothetical protein
LVFCDCLTQLKEIWTYYFMFPNTINKTGNVRTNVTLTRARSRSHCCHWKAISITYSECTFVALGIQHTCMRHIVTCGSCPALQFFSTLSHKWQDFQVKKVTKHNVCVLSFSTMFIWNISQSQEKSARYYHKHIYIFIESTCYSYQILKKYGFSQQISKKILKYQISRKSAQWELSCSKRIDGRNGWMDGWRNRQTSNKAISPSPFLQFCKHT